MNLTISDLLNMQRALQERHLADWGGTPPSAARSQLLWGIGEIGEVIDIIKKRGDDAILNDPETREHFIEEMADVWMYLCDVLLCYNISADELSTIYTRKHNRNMHRDWKSDAQHMFDDK